MSKVLVPGASWHQPSIADSKSKGHWPGLWGLRSPTGVNWVARWNSWRGSLSQLWVRGPHLSFHLARVWFGRHARWAIAITACSRTVSFHRADSWDVQSLLFEFHLRQQGSHFYPRAHPLAFCTRHSRLQRVRFLAVSWPTSFWFRR